MDAVLLALLKKINSKVVEVSTAVNTKRYGVRWDKVNAQCTRLYDAAGITLVTTSFGHFGSVNLTYNNPFDNIKPWSGRKLVNVDLATYKILQTAGGNVF